MIADDIPAGIVFLKFVGGKQIGTLAGRIFGGIGRNYVVAAGLGPVLQALKSGLDFGSREEMEDHSADNRVKQAVRYKIKKGASDGCDFG